jgi:hypothetical protein
MGTRTSTVRKSGQLPTSKPMASARRVSLFRREIRISLSSAAIDILFARAAVLSEGQADESGYFGSTMITIDCARAADLVSDPCDAATVERIATLISIDERVAQRARGIGIKEAERLAGSRLSAPKLDMHVRQNGVHLHIDLDVEAATKSAAAVTKTAGAKN